MKVLDRIPMSDCIEDEFGTFRDDVEAIMYNEESMTEGIVKIPTYYITGADMTSYGFDASAFFIVEDDEEEE